MSAPLYYDVELDEQCGYWDALQGAPRASTQSGYRRGYDRGLGEVCRALALDPHADDYRRDEDPPEEEAA